MRRFALIGKPLAHSASPALFRHWFARHGIEAEYRALAIDESGIDGALEMLAAGKLDGANVTIPYKERFFQKLSSLDDAARAIGAVNTLLPAGKDVRGLNTDAPAFAGWLSTLRGESALPIGVACVFGSGGAARAVVHALLGQGVWDIRLVARNPKAASAIRAMGGRIGCFGWERAGEAAAGAALLINATPLGQAGFPAFPRISLPRAKDGLALDLVYNPPRTAFLDLAAARGFQTANGFPMLVHQAALAFKAWFGFTPEAAGAAFESLTGKTEGNQA